MNRITKSINRQISSCFIFIVCMFILNFSVAFAYTESDSAFASMISSFSEKGLIPETNGKFLSLGDYKGSLANMGYSSMIPLMDADHFVISADLEWFSANMTPNSVTNGCGFFFGAANGTYDHLMVSLRGDGNLYFTGYRNYTVLSYGKYSIALPSRTGSGELCLIVDGKSATVYLNGEQFLQQSGLSVAGNIFGLAVLSGTYQDYGTRCLFSNIHVYTWE